jgi:hypothetical protein
MKHRIARRVVVASLILTVMGVLRGEEPKPQDRDAPQTTAAFLDAALSRKFKEAAAMGEPGKAYSREEAIRQFAELNVKKLAIVSVHADPVNALSITENVKGDHNREGPLVLTLVRKDGRWLIRDVDLETEASAKDELERFLKKYPDARSLPEK